MPAQLLIIAGPDQGKTFPLSPGAIALIGRSRTATVQLSDPHASRSHCQVKMEGGRILVEDLDSVGGIFVNDARVSSHALRAGDVLRVGSTLLRLEWKDLADQATLAPPPDPPRAIAGAGAFVPTAAFRPTAVPLPPPASPPPPAPRPVAPVAQPPLYDLVGQTLKHFQIGQVIAPGKTGVVFRARDSRDGKELALKVFLPEFGKDEAELQRFLRAMKTMMPLRHPHLVAIHHAGRTGQHCWVSMDLVEGTSLVPALQHAATGQGDWRFGFRVALHVCRALVYLHGRNIIHRNIAPPNVLLNTIDGTVRLGDLMTVKAQEGKLAKQVTQAGEILGDLRFLSPEQTANASGGDGRADLYSLGATTYAVLTGRPPLEGKTFVETILKIRQTPPPPPRQLQPAILPAFEAVVLKLLAKKPEDRFQTPAELLAQLDSLAPALK
jgi:Protein kinase domain/Inner membrane component of T3SS, cytoplasmic domain